MSDRVEIDRLRSQIDDLRDQLADFGAEAGDRADIWRRKSARQMRRMYGQARHYAHDAQEVVGTQVGRNPIASLLIAFGVGIALGKLLDLGRS
ncbi:hypothetical protein [Caenispirillum bisanense]|uniref:hypothetical protein n=1 Tax=Caenispirillum bisanense TaxID=414052 RepID=UPI0031CE9018